MENARGGSLGLIIHGELLVPTTGQQGIYAFENWQPSSLGIQPSNMWTQWNFSYQRIIHALSFDNSGTSVYFIPPSPTHDDGIVNYTGLHGRIIERGPQEIPARAVFSDIDKVPAHDHYVVVEANLVFADEFFWRLREFHESAPYAHRRPDAVTVVRLGCEKTVSSEWMMFSHSARRRIVSKCGRSDLQNLSCFQHHPVNILTVKGRGRAIASRLDHSMLPVLRTPRAAKFYALKLSDLKHHDRPLCTSDSGWMSTVLQDHDSYLGLIEFKSQNKAMLYGRHNTVLNKGNMFQGFIYEDRSSTSFLGERHITINGGPAHNLCALSLSDSGHIRRGEIFAIGGQSRSRTNDGVYLLSLNLTSMIWKKELKLFDGSQQGCIEKRERWNGKCEFDGMCSIVHHRSNWMVFCRANTHSPGGYRNIQVTMSPQLSPTSSNFGPFELLKIEGHIASHNIYLMHPYKIPRRDMLLGIASLVREKDGGIFSTLSCDGVNWSPFSLLVPSSVIYMRTSILPVMGGVRFLDADTFQLAVHHNVADRLGPVDPRRLLPYVRWHTFHIWYDFAKLPC